jgi:hypothetical protein
MRVLLALALCCVLLSLVGRVAAQSPFPIQLGSTGIEYGKCAAKTADGGIVIGMVFQNTVDFDPGTGTATLGTPPGVDCAIVKYDPSGALRWARSLSGPATGTSASVVITPHGITTDTDGNVIVIGYFGLSGSTTQATVDFDPGTGTYDLTNTGGWDPFILKLDASGNFVWARTLGATTAGSTDERLWDVVTDTSGAIYVTGFIQGTFDLDPGAGVASFTSAGEKDLFLAKYTATGDYVWGFTVADTGDTATSLKETSVTLDSAGHVFLTGHFNGTADFDSGTGTANLTSVGQADFFLARYAQSDGAYQMAVRLGSGYNDTAPPGTARIGPDGNLYLTGRFRGTVDLDPGTGTTNVTNSGTDTTDNIWVASYTTDLALRWGFSIASDNGLDGAHRVDFDPTGSGLYVAGWFSGVTDFDGGTGTYTLTSKNDSAGAAADIFLAKYHRDTGAFMWACGVGGTVTDQGDLSITAGLAVDDDGCAYVTGQLFGTDITFYDASGTQANSPTWNSLGSNDAYVIKYNPSGGLWQATDLQTWRQTEFSTMANTGTAANTADSDGDGIVNLLEYALGSEPDSSASCPDVTSQISDLKLQITFTPQRSDITYTIEASSDLSDWSNSTNVTSLLTVGQSYTHTDTTALGGTTTKRFLRLKVSQP